MFMLLVWEERRHDFLVMMTHHLVTIFLISFSYYSGCAAPCLCCLAMLPNRLPPVEAVQASAKQTLARYYQACIVLLGDSLISDYVRHCFHHSIFLRSHSGVVPFRRWSHNAADHLASRTCSLSCTSSQSICLCCCLESLMTVLCTIHLITSDLAATALTFPCPVTSANPRFRGLCAGSRGSEPW